MKNDSKGHPKLAGEHNSNEGIQELVELGVIPELKVPIGPALYGLFKLLATIAQDVPRLPANGRESLDST